MIEIGTVEWFDVRETKQFGFLRLVETGEKVFFHYNDGRPIIAGRKRPDFSAEATIQHAGKLARLKKPQEGDELIFVRKMGSKGPKAFPWGYKLNWRAVELEIARRPIYKVFESRNPIGCGAGDPQILWYGSDLHELLEFYPRTRSIGDDPLLPYWADADGIFEVRRWWVMKLPGGLWEYCDDPRPIAAT